MSRLLARSVAALLLILVFLAGVICMIPKHKWGPIATPVRAFWVTIHEDDHDQFIEKMKSFAKENDFSFSATQVTPDKRDIMIDLRRKNLIITATNPVRRREFCISIDKEVETTVADDAVNALVKSLESFVPGLTEDPNPEKPIGSKSSN
jgi:hypothetical protein